MDNSHSRHKSIDYGEYLNGLYWSQIKTYDLVSG